MKKVNVICVGKIKEKFFADAISEYLKRLSKYAEVKITELPDFPDRPDAVKREGDSILSLIKKPSVLLDIGGEQLDSVQLANFIDSAYISASEITFIIGGSCGVSGAVQQAVDKRISFGRVTYPHQLMRVILCEQLYRAFTISVGAVYHK